MSLNKILIIVMSRAVVYVILVLALGLRPRTNTTALGQLTVPISNLLFINM